MLQFFSNNHTNFTVIIVNHTLHPFRINVGFFINQPIGFSREFPFQIDTYTFEPDFPVTDLSGTAVINRTQQGLRLKSHFIASTTATCSRCLDDFQLLLKTNFEELFTYREHPLSENESIIPADGFLDIEDLVSDYLELEIPIQPICRVDCRGLCRICGQNWNHADCEHSPRTKVSLKDRDNTPDAGDA